MKIVLLMLLVAGGVSPVMADSYRANRAEPAITCETGCSGAPIGLEELPLTQDTLAQMLGIRRTSVTLLAQSM